VRRGDRAWRPGLGRRRRRPGQARAAGAFAVAADAGDRAGEQGAPRPRGHPQPRPGAPAALSRPASEREALPGARRARQLCEARPPLGPRPLLRASETASLLVVGQAPGTLVHGSGIPWDDASGVRLRGWMGLDKAAFYDEAKVAIVPMGFCYP